MVTRKKQALDFREIRRMLWRRKIIILVPIVVTMGIAAYQALTMPATFASTATLAPENPLPLTRRVAEFVGGGDGGARRGRDDGSRAVRARIMSSRFLEAIAVQIGFHENPALVHAAKATLLENPGHDEQDLVLRQCVTRLRKMIKVSGGTGGSLSITVASTSPRLAQLVATTVAEQYLQTMRQLRLQSTEEALGLAQEPMAKAAKELEEKRGALREYEQTLAVKPLTSSPVSRDNVSRVNSLIKTAEADLQFQRGKNEAVLGRIREAGLEPFLGFDLFGSPKLAALRETLFGLERSLALAQVENPEGSGVVSSSQSQIAVTSQQILTELEVVAASQLASVVPEYRQLLVDQEFTRVAIDAAGARVDQLRGFLDRYERDLATMPAEEFRLQRLKEEVANAERIYQIWHEQASNSQIAQSVQSTEAAEKLVLLEPAILPLEPFAPDRERILLVALAMGVALGIGAAVLTEYFDLTLKSVEEIEALLGAPILGAVPRMQALVVEDLEQRRIRRIWIFAGSSVLILAAAVAVGVLHFTS
ncbi:MAG: GumC family protein [Candidatus Eiseniibacteriota bacterium]